MKKILLLISILILTGCTKNIEPTKVKVEVEENFSVYVDPRIELITVIQYLSDYPILSDLDMLYKDDIDDYFSDFKDHEAVTEFKRLMQFGFTYHVPVTLMLSTNINSFEVNYDAPSDIITRVGGYDSAEKYLLDVKDFYEESNFSRFYNEHIELYNNIVNTYTDKIADKSSINKLESYYGDTQNSYSIILSPLLHPGGYGPRLLNENGEYDIYSVIGPKTAQDALPEFEFSNYLTFHEFGHSFVNPIVDKRKSQAMTYSSLFKPIKEEMSKQAYSSWITSLDEHIVRAVVARISLDMEDKEMYDTIVEVEKSRGFIYIDHILDQLIIYENNRDKYKTFEDFFPELLKSFDSLI